MGTKIIYVTWRGTRSQRRSDALRILSYKNTCPSCPHYTASLPLPQIIVTPSITTLAIIQPQTTAIDYQIIPPVVSFSTASWTQPCLTVIYNQHRLPTSYHHNPALQFHTAHHCFTTLVVMPVLTPPLQNTVSTDLPRNTVLPSLSQNTVLTPLQQNTTFTS